MQFSALTVLDVLQASDLDWIEAHAQEVRLQQGEVLLKAGQVNTDIFIVDRGLLTVVAGKAGAEHELLRAGPGSMLGDISWLDNQATGATIYALEESRINRLPGVELAQKAAGDAGFAARLYQGLARLNALRLKETLARLVRQAATVRRTEQKSAAAHGVLQQLEELKATLVDLDKKMLGRKAITFDAAMLQLEPLFSRLAGAFDSWMRNEEDEETRLEVGALVQREMLPYLTQAQLAERTYAKPRGYAGDYKMIALMYENQAQGHGRLGPLLERCFLNRPACKAVRNRRFLLGREIAATLQQYGDAEITGLACGPATELRDVLLQQPQARLHYHGVDIDDEALHYVHHWAQEIQGQTQISTVHGNLLLIANGRQKLDIPPQHFIYSIGLIDYLNDGFVIKLLNWAHARLAPGGRVMLGNFHKRNPDRALMDHVLDWRLIHRDEDDMQRLFAASAFGQGCSRIVFEEEGVNLFAEGVKSA